MVKAPFPSRENPAKKFCSMCLIKASEGNSRIWPPKRCGY